MRNALLLILCGISTSTTLAVPVHERDYPSCGDVIRTSLVAALSASACSGAHAIQHNVILPRRMNLATKCAVHVADPNLIVRDCIDKLRHRRISEYDPVATTDDAIAFPLLQVPEGQEMERVSPFDENGVSESTCCYCVFCTKEEDTGRYICSSYRWCGGCFEHADIYSEECCRTPHMIYDKVCCCSCRMGSSVNVKWT